MQAVGVLTILWAAWAASLSAQNTRQIPARPDVFLITIDTLRADHLHCYGYNSIQTPGLDRLAQDGVRFIEAFTPSPITNTSHTSILTGLLPSSHRVTDFGVPLSDAYPTLPDLLKKGGYKTAAFIGSVILDSGDLAPGLDRGFDFYDNFPHPAQTKSRWGRLERRGAVVIRRAENWLTAHPAGPHFVWIHLYDPHDPYEPPPPYSQTYKGRLYDGEIAYADSAVSGFVSYLEKRGWYANSIVIVVGDHGEGLGEHREETHGLFLYDSTTRVPLIVKLPGGATSGRVVNGQVRTLDILPTILDLLHIPAPDRLDGESLRPYFSHSDQKDRVVLGETDYPLRFGWAPLRSVRADRLKFIEAPRPELYDLHRDAGEERNNYAPWNLSVQKFRSILADLRPKVSPARASTAGSISQSTIDELQALGYLTRADAGTSTSVPEPSLLPDPKDKIEEQNLLHRALIASEDGRKQDAVTALKKVIDLDPGSATALGQLGEMELHAEAYSDAVQHLARARELRPNDSRLPFEEGQAREKTGDLAGAQEALQASLKIEPTRFRARLLLGDVYLKLKKWKLAEDQYQAALLLEPESNEAQLSIAKSREMEKAKPADEK